MDRKKTDKRITIKDIAKYTGYSIATVSRVINDKGIYYSSDTYDKIQKATEILGYHPNAIARGLKTKKTSNIAFFEPWIGEFFSEVFLGTQDAANHGDYSAAIFSSDYKVEQEKKNIDSVLSNRFDGIIVCSAILDKNNLAKILQHNIPLVIIEKFLNNPNIPYVSIKNRIVTKKAIDYLVNLGHKKIGFVSQTLEIGKHKNRFKGYKDSLEENGLKFSNDRLIVMEKLEKENFETSYRFIQNNISKIKKCSAIFVTSDIIAISAIKALNDFGFKIPNDLSIMGFDGLNLARYIHPSLTTIVQPRFEMGYKAMHILADLIDGKKPGNVELSADILVGESTGKP
jgi:LacI family transcriptional regulator